MSYGYGPPQPAPPRQRTPQQTLLIGGGVLAVLVLFVVSCGALVSAAGDPQPTKTVTVVKTKTVTVQAAPKAAAATPSAAVTAKPKPVKMPRVIGRNGAAAQALLVKLGIGTGDIQFGSADPGASVVLLPQNWEVVRQDPRAGATVRPGDAVVLTMKKLA